MNKIGSIETRDLDGEILETLVLSALIALEKRRILSKWKVLEIACVEVLTRPQEGASIVEHDGADIGI